MGPITSIWDIPRILWRRFWLILLVLVIGLPLCVLYALSLPRVYEATAVVQIEAPQVVQQITSQTGAGTRALNSDSELDLIEQRLMSRDNILTVADRFDLFAEEPSDTVRVGLMRDSVIISPLIDPAQAWRPEVHPTGLAITVRLGDPDLAAGLANTLMEQIMAEAQDRTSGRTARTLEFLVSEEDRLLAEITEQEFLMTEFRQANAGALPAAISSQRTQLASLEETRIEIETQLVELAATADQLLADTLQRRQALLDQRLELVVAAIAEIEAEIAAAPEVERQLSVFERQLEQLQDELGVITASRAEAAMNQLLESRNQAERFEILETAIPPEFAVSASRRKIAMAGGILVGLMAVALVLALEILDGRIRTPKHLEREFEIIPVVSIPDLARGRRRYTGRWLALGGLAALGLGAFGLVQGWFRGLFERRAGAERHPAE